MKKYIVCNRRICILSIVFLLLSLLLPFYLAAEENEEKEWEKLSTEGKIEWLSSNPSDTRFFRRLHTTASSIKNVEPSASLLRRFLPMVETKEQRYKTLLRLARIEEGMGKFDSAQLHFQSAASLPRDTWDYNALFSSAMLLIELGEYTYGKLQLERIAREAETKELKLKAEAHLARVHLLKGDIQESKESLKSLLEADGKTPDIYYLLYVLSLNLDMRGSATEIKQELIQQFPGSPEAGMVTGLVKQAASVERVFGLLDVPASTENEEEVVKKERHGQDDKERVGEGEAEETIRGIQTGSFRDKENAVYMEKELQKQGFTTSIEKTLIDETEYHKVIVRIFREDSAQKTLIRLKEKGFEGIPVY